MGIENLYKHKCKIEEYRDRFNVVLDGISARGLEFAIWDLHTADKIVWVKYCPHCGMDLLKEYSKQRKANYAR